MSMLFEILHRMKNSHLDELMVAAREQMKITEGRLRKNLKVDIEQAMQSKSTNSQNALTRVRQACDSKYDAPELHYLKTLLR